MVGTIRRPLPGVNTNSGDSGAPPPPSYQAATSPTSSSSSGANRQSGIPAAAFQRQQQQGGSNSTGRPFSTPDASMYNNNNQAARPLSQASIPSQRPGSYAAPPGAPPGQPQYQQKSSSASYQQPMGSPPRSASSSSAGPSHAPAGGAQVQRSNSQEDRLAVLRRYDTCILIDDSASMHNLWREAEAALAGIVQQVIRYDADGLDVYFLNSTHSIQGAKEPGAIRELFQYVGPVGESTPTEIRVEELLSPYIDACERAKRNSQAMPKPLNLLILTDGEADDPDTLAYSLQGFAKRLDDIRAPLTQLGVQFVQIGDDPAATDALKELDDNLQGCRDMVDTTPYAGKVTPDFLIKVALGSINRRIDRSG